MGAEFVLTGSVNRCTVEAGTSAAAKDLLQTVGTEDMDHAPAGDMFETGQKVQVVRRGLSFVAHANELFELYRHHESIEEIAPQCRQRLESDCFGKTLHQVWQEIIAYSRLTPEHVSQLESRIK